MKKIRLKINQSRNQKRLFAFIFLFAFCFSLNAQEYPKEVRGYKVVKAKVEVKRQKDSQTDNKTQTQNTSGDNPQTQTQNNTDDTDALVQVGDPKVVRVTPLGVTFEIPVTVAAVKQGGKVDILVFENVTANNTNVTIEDYATSFDLPNDKPKELPRPIRVFVSTPNAVTNIMGEVMNSKDTWQVKGRVYVCGHYNKFIFKFKRAVPIEFDLTIPNPIKLNNLKPKTN